MKVAFFSTHRFERGFFEAELARSSRHQFTFFETRLTAETALAAAGHPGVCAFVNDRLDLDAVSQLSRAGVQLIALRSAGFNHVDLRACAETGIKVVRVPSYSPHAVAEHALALILSLNRKVHRAYQRVRELDFSLDGLVGFDLNGKTVGVIGTGSIGSVFAKIVSGLGCRVLALDVEESRDLVDRFGVDYVDLDTICRQSDIISLHVPLTPTTRHLIDAATLGKMKRGAMLINTGRGGLIDTLALIDALKSGRIGAAGLDVYEEEEGVFFLNLSDGILSDDVLARLLTFPQVLVTSHQGFLTQEALTNIARTTIQNISEFEDRRNLSNEVRIIE